MIVFVIVILMLAGFVSGWAVRSHLSTVYVDRPVEVEVPVPAVQDVTLYRPDVELLHLIYDRTGLSDLCKQHFPTCEAAFAAIAARPESKWQRINVKPVEAVRVGRRYFQRTEPLEVIKPKVEK